MGVEDTLAYYSAEDSVAGFQVRVIKQSNGSSGDGIWIMKLEAGNTASPLEKGHARTTRCWT